MTFGQFIRTRRLATSPSLRAFCAEHGFDPSNFSKLERDLLPPPINRKKLAQYARALGIEEPSVAWGELCDLVVHTRCASIDNRLRIPPPFG